MRMPLGTIHPRKQAMTHELTGQLEIEDRGAVLVTRVDGGPHALFGWDIAGQLEESVDRALVLEPVVSRTPLWPAVQLDRLHATFLRMNRSGTVFVAALNGSALGLGAEFAWACDLRVMADGDFFIGQPSRRTR